MASCSAAGGTAQVALPVLLRTLDSPDEGWLASPGVADLDGDGTVEIVAPRDERLVVWHADGSVVWQVVPGPGRIWAPPVLADLQGDADLEVAIASRQRLHVYTAAGAPAGGFPKDWRDEVRTLAAGDLFGNGNLSLVAVTTNRLEAGGQRDVIMAYRSDGAAQPGFPPNTSGTSGCTAICYPTGGFDQNLAIGRLDGDAAWDVVSPHDNAYISWHHGSGVAFDAAAIFEDRVKVPGIRMLHDYAEAQQGYATTESTALQGHFTNSPPALADIDGDGTAELVVVGSVQNASQSDRLKGVALWLLDADGTRQPGWETPFHVPAYLGGLNDLGNNVVGLTNQVTVAELDPAAPGKEMLFAGYDGRIHCVRADRTECWDFPYTTDADTFTPGILVADLSRDGVPEVVFASYSARAGRSSLFVVDARGLELHRIPLPGRGAMAVPTIADVDGDDDLEIVVSLKDDDVLVYTVAESADNCLLWPTGRGNNLRTAWIP